MSNTLKVSAFILIIVAAIAGFASMIPQLESPAPETLEISGELSGAELAELGHTVFESPEAGCLACHALGREGLRGPDLANIGATAAERVPGQTAEVYLHESLVDPCAHVVEGYDCLMPQTLEQTLGPAKITALVAYLQSLGGEVTVSLTAEENAGDAQGEAQPAGTQGTTPQEIFASAGCVACHTVESLGFQGIVGPDLSTLGAQLTADEIRQAILDPDTVIAAECPVKDASENLTTAPCTPGIMPKDYGQKLNASQLETLVVFLSELK
jgi:cytochrome c551/c552